MELAIICFDLPCAIFKREREKKIVSRNEGHWGRNQLKVRSVERALIHYVCHGLFEEATGIPARREKV